MFPGPPCLFFHASISRRHASQLSLRSRSPVGLLTDPHAHAHTCTQLPRYLFNLDMWALDLVERRLRERLQRPTKWGYEHCVRESTGSGSSESKGTIEDLQNRAVLALQDMPQNLASDTSAGEARTTDALGDSLGPADVAKADINSVPGAAESQTAEEQVRDEVMTEVEGAGQLIGIDAKW